MDEALVAQVDKVVYAGKKNVEKNLAREAAACGENDFDALLTADQNKSRLRLV